MERGGIVPFILNLDTTWKVVTSFRTRPPYTREVTVRKLVRNRSISESFGNEKSLVLLPGIPLKFLDWPSRSLGTVSTILSGPYKAVEPVTRGDVRERILL